MHFLTFDTKTKLITFGNTFITSIGWIILYEVLKSKVEAELALFLTLILFSLVKIGK